MRSDRRRLDSSQRDWALIGACLETALLEPRAHSAREKPIPEAITAERDAARTVRRGCTADPSGEALEECRVKERRAKRRVVHVDEVLEQRQEVELSVRGKAIAARQRLLGTMALGEMLEGGCGIDAEEPGSRIEQTSGAAREGAVEPAMQRGQQRCGRMHAKAGRHRRFPEHEERRRRHAPRLPLPLGDARHRQRREAADEFAAARLEIEQLPSARADLVTAEAIEHYAERWPVHDPCVSLAAGCVHRAFLFHHRSSDATSLPFKRA
jgi:hypothetical protein